MGCMGVPIVGPIIFPLIISRDLTFSHANHASGYVSYGHIMPSAAFIGPSSSHDGVKERFSLWPAHADMILGRYQRAIGRLFGQLRTCNGDGVYGGPHCCPIIFRWSIFRCITIRHAVQASMYT
eukprot:TRINITY_DN1376_c0_g1_i11.p1 TRINITY_DN1376_c0_g1~~TRINITY_DN1376_c0_g1_i11.p1  ORF type:complete len:124 (-),score=1.29 TRINITY_DN1376_c0_g1_i11:111-482(-)